MKRLFQMVLVIVISCCGAFQVHAQTADEIISNYFENTGGYDAWGNLKGIKMTAMFNQGGMEIPIEIVRLADGRTYTSISFQGMRIYQGVFDGSTLWSTNFQTMKPEKSDDQTTANFSLEANDFPDHFYDYKTKGYSVEYVGQETFEGTETFKIKLVKEPKTVDGQKVEDISYYYFDTESYVPIAMESEVHEGPMKGMIQMITLSDYQEVEGLYFPFSMTQGVKGSPGQPFSMESIEINPTIEDSAFVFPAEGKQ